MSATILDGKALAARMRGEVAIEAARLRAAGIEPGLAVVLVGDDPASQIYVRSKTAGAAEAGIRTFDHRLPATTTEAELLALVAKLNADPAVDGILIQLPLPRGLDARRILLAVDPAQGRRRHPPREPRPPADGRAAVRRLHAARGDEAHRRRRALSLAGANAVVVGRSNMVGKPMAALLLQRERDGDDLPLEDRAISPAVVRARRPRGRGGRARRDGPRRLDQAGRGGDRRRHQPARRRQAGRRRRVRRRPHARARRSRRCPAASDR